MPAPSFAAPVRLQGPHGAVLEPLQADHVAQLQAAVADGELWRLWYTTHIPSPDGMATEVAQLLRQQAAGEVVPFVVRAGADGRIVGATRYMALDEANRRLEIGGTWYAQSVQRTGLNTECKWLLLRHAFEQLRCHAVELRTHFINHASRRAIERLGARLDGVLRQHRVLPNGTLRDTCVYSILAGEWPTVQAHLQWQLERPR